MTSAWRLVVLTALCIAVPSRAQRVAGAVRDAESGQGVAGAVVSLLSPSGDLVGRSLSDATGRFSLPRGSAATIRVIRLGFRPQSAPLPHSGDALALDITMERVPILLSSVTVAENATCPRSDGGAALGVWEQARSALLASIVAREANPAVATNVEFERTFGPADRIVLHQRTRTTSGRTTRPFRAARPAPELALAGYARAGSDGRYFDIPDPDVLLDDSFAATHCFHVEQGGSARPGEIGLAFEPAPGRETLVDVRGVLWMLATPPELRAIEFRFTGLSAAEMREGAGGTIEFANLSNGLVVIRSWVVRLPILQETRLARRSTVRLPTGAVANAGQGDSVVWRVLQRRESGGVLARATWPDAVTFESPRASVAGRVIEERSNTPLRGVIISVVGAADSAFTDADGWFDLRTPFEGEYVVRVTDTSRSFISGPRFVESRVATSLARPATLDVRLPGPGVAVARACRTMIGRTQSTVSGTDTAASDRVAPLVGRVLLSAGLSTRALTIAARWQADYVFGAAQHGGVAILEDGGQLELDDDGQFVFCSVARERRVSLRLEKAGVTLGDTLVVIARDSAMGIVEWRPGVTARMLADAAPATFRGVVRRASDGAPVAGADVWIPAMDRRTTTDSTGAFRLGDLRTGHVVVQTRRVGFYVSRDTVTLTRGQELRREYALLAQGAMLDTVHTIARRSASAMLRSFDERRSRGIGRYLGASELRERNESDLASTLLDRIPGLTTARTPLGGEALVSTRKSCAGSVLLASCQPCYVSVYIDGVAVYSSTANTGAPPPDLRRLRNAEFAGVEFYGSGVTPPPEYSGTDSGCGTLLLWTRIE